MRFGMGLGLGLGSRGGGSVTAPLAPVATAATDILESALTANWEESIGARSYTLEYGHAVDVNNSPTWVGATILTEITDNYKTLTGLTEAKTYYYRVKAVNAGGESNASNTIAARTNLLMVFKNNPAALNNIIQKISLTLSEEATFTCSGGISICATESGTYGTSIDYGSGEAVIYVKTVDKTANGYLSISKDKIITKLGTGDFGGGSLVRYVSGGAAINIMSFDFNLDKVAAAITGIAQYIGGFGGKMVARFNGAMPASGYVYMFAGDATTMIYLATSSAFAANCTSIQIISENINWDVLSLAGTSNFNNKLTLTNWRTEKLTDAQLITLIGTIASRNPSTAKVPTSITIGDYANYSSPPQSVLDAIDALKAIHTYITTVTLSGE